MSSVRLPEEMVLAYASGQLNEAMSLVVASHLVYAPESRRDVARYEALGGALLEELEPSEMHGDVLERTLALIDDEEDAEIVEPELEVRDGLALPASLRRYVGPDIEALAWRKVMKGVQDVELGVSPGCRTRLMRIEPGVTVPRHSHRGAEVTLVLRGAYEDETGHYGPGAVQMADENVDHQPSAVGEETCLCLVVRDAPIRLSGRIGKLLNPFIRY